jgi:hypothetical protein
MPCRNPCTLGAHVRTHRAATLHPRSAHALLLRRNVALSERTCAPTATQCGTPGAHVRAYCDATCNPRRAHARLLRRNVSPSERTCAPAATQRGILGAHVRSCCDTTSHPRCACARMLLQTLHFGPGHAVPLDKPTQPDLTFCYKVEDRKNSDFGGCRRYGRAG